MMNRFVVIPRNWTVPLALGLSVVAVVCISGHALGAPQAGVAAAVRGDVRRIAIEHGGNTSSGVIGRIVTSGDEIFLEDRIETGPGSGLQIMLLDETIFTIGPDATLVIDKFVYDPDKGTGTLAAAVVKGAFRFVSGRIANDNPASVNIRVGIATMGIRGTVAAGVVTPPGPGGEPGRSDVVLLGPGSRNNTGERIGRITLSNGNSTVEISRPGFGSSVVGELGLPSPPAPMELGQVSQLTQAPTDAGGEDSGDSTAGETLQVNEISGQTLAAASNATVNVITNSDVADAADSQLVKATETTQSTLQSIAAFEDLRSIESGTASFTMHNVPLTYQSGPTENSGGSYNASFLVDFSTRSLDISVSQLNYFFADQSERSAAFDDRVLYSGQSGPTTTSTSSDQQPGAFRLGEGEDYPDTVRVEYEILNQPESAIIANAARINVTVESADDGTVIAGGRTSQRGPVPLPES
jgi:hypothetical protein